MVQVLEMAQKGGRPKKGDEGGTRQIRVAEDLANMIAWIARIKGIHVAQLIDPMLRPDVLAQYGEIERDVGKIQEAERLAMQAEQDAKQRLQGRKKK